jgi:hypothetical protein
MYEIYIHIHQKNFHRLMNIYYLNHDIPEEEERKYYRIKNKINELEDKPMDLILLTLQWKIVKILLFVVYVNYRLNIVDVLKIFFVRFLREYMLIILVFCFRVL